MRGVLNLDHVKLIHLVHDLAVSQLVSPLLRELKLLQKVYL